MTIYLQNLEWAENFDMNKINFSRSVFFKKMAQIRPEMLRTTVFATFDIIGSKVAVRSVELSIFMGIDFP